MSQSALKDEPADLIPEELPLLSWTPQQAVAGTIVIAGTVLAFWLAYLFERVLVCLLIGIVLDIALVPLVVRLTNAGAPRSLAVTIVYLSLGVAAISVAIVGIPKLIEQSMSVANELPESYSKLRTRLVSTSSERVSRLASRLPEEWPPLPLDGPIGVELSEAVVSNREPLGNVANRTVFLTLGVILLAFYWSLHGPRTIAAGLLLLPEQKRQTARDLVAEIHNRVGGFIRGQGLLCVIVGCLSFAAFWWIGLPYALLLAAVAGLMEMLPYFGPTLGSVPAVLTALTVQPELAIWTLGVCILVQVVENNLLVPKIMGKSVGVHPVGIMLAMLCFGTLLGGIGIVVAIPFAAVLQIFAERFLLGDESVDVPAPAARNRLSRLRYEANDLIQDVRQQLRKKDEPAVEGSDELENEIESIATELERALSDLEQGPDQAVELQMCALP